MLNIMKQKREEEQAPFLTNVQQLRERARAHIAQGAVTPSYEGSLQQAISILQAALATELVCWLRYAPGIVSL